MKLIVLGCPWLLMAVVGSAAPAAWAADGATTRPAGSQPDARATTGPDVPVALSFTMKTLAGEEVPIADDLKGPVKWNFEKFLIDRKGQVIARYRSGIKPEQIAKDIEAALGK